MKNGEKIMVVDDEEAVRNLCVRALKKGNHQVVSASSGDQALEWLAKESFNFDLVITDLSMPGKTDGKTLLSQIKKQSKTTDVIIMTAHPSIESTVLALKEGAYDYIIKPINSHELDSTVARCLEKRHLKIKLDQAYKELKTLNDFRELFMQLLVHDMKNPLSGIMGNAQILLMDSLGPEQKETVEDILKSSERLNQMVENLLGVAKMEEGRLVPHYSTVVVRELFAETEKTISGELKPRNIRFSFRVEPDDLVLWADRELAARLLKNLLENSSHYTFENGSIELSAARQGNEHCFIRVKDNGQKVSEEFKESIFTRSGRLTKSGERNNRGLGLYFCKLAAEAHGGSIELEDSAEGCAFLIKLPLRKEK